ncbi:MAG: 16S rRNA (cytosine(1402)-N(4))-methyltransferase RsmH [Phycisphaerae bacterium]|jgi:16S rRNA (cytosine1402-N4)-methyltransferase
MTADMNDGEGTPGGKPPRRKRYRGTHPRKFQERYKELKGDPGMHAHIRARGRTPAGTHVSVLFNEVMKCLAPRPGEIVADCTLGYGGHASGFLKRISPGGLLVGFDHDEATLRATHKRLLTLAASLGSSQGEEGHEPADASIRDSQFATRDSSLVSAHHMNFAGIGNVLTAEGLDGYDVIFADLGVSSMQVDDPTRGISYKHEGPLDMRMDKRLGQTGADLLATLSEEELSKALWEFSDEADHAKIAQWIVRQRTVGPIATTAELTRLVMNAKGISPRARHRPWEVPGGLHPAAKTFQALRILVNDELGSLRALLRIAPHCLHAGGRVGIISFHSGEDRLVKHAFRDGLADGTYSAISEHVIVPTSEEVRDNPRSSSAKFRWARKAQKTTTEATEVTEAAEETRE